MKADVLLDRFVPEPFRRLTDPARDLPRLAKDPSAMAAITAAAAQVPTSHRLLRGDARRAVLPARSVHLVLTSPPYWTLKEYRRSAGQLGWIADYDEFLDQLDEVWRMCHAALVPGGRLICVVGDVCLSRRKNGGRHTVVPLHASIQSRCRALGFDNLAPIIWHKIANAAHEAERRTSDFLGKPYEPNAVIKNDVEFILMQRKPGGYRQPTLAARVLSLLPKSDFKTLFRQIWTDIAGASTRDHPAPYPVPLATRLIRMFSFVGDTVLDPFMGTASTNVAAASCGRNSFGIEVEPTYFKQAATRLATDTADLPCNVKVATSSDCSSQGFYPIQRRNPDGARAPRRTVRIQRPQRYRPGRCRGFSAASTPTTCKEE